MLINQHLTHVYFILNLFIFDIHTYNIENLVVSPPAKYDHDFHLTNSYTNADSIITLTNGTNRPKNIQIETPFPKLNILLNCSVAIQN